MFHVPLGSKFARLATRRVTLIQGLAIPLPREKVEATMLTAWQRCFGVRCCLRCQEPLVASLLLVARMLLVVMPLVASSDALVASSLLLLVVRPAAPSSVLAPSSDALCS